MSVIILIMFLFLSCCSLKKDKEIVKDVEEVIDDLLILEEEAVSSCS